MYAYIYIYVYIYIMKTLVVFVSSIRSRIDNIVSISMISMIIIDVGQGILRAPTATATSY